MVNIIDYIPVGHDNSVSRCYLSLMTGMKDRSIREAIAKARKDGEIILHRQADGSGYYRPGIADRTYIQQYIKSEESRLKSIGASLKSARKMMRECENQIGWSGQDECK